MNRKINQIRRVVMVRPGSLFLFCAGCWVVSDSPSVCAVRGTRGAVLEKAGSLWLVLVWQCSADTGMKKRDRHN